MPSRITEQRRRMSTLVFQKLGSQKACSKESSDASRLSPLITLGGKMRLLIASSSAASLLTKVGRLRHGVDGSALRARGHADI